MAVDPLCPDRAVIGGEIELKAIVTVCDTKGDGGLVSTVMYRFEADEELLQRKYPLRLSTKRAARFRQLYNDYLGEIETLPFDALGIDDQIDFVVFRNHLQRSLHELELIAGRHGDIRQILPFINDLLALEEERQRMEWLAGDAAASRLHSLLEHVLSARASFDGSIEGDAKDGRCAPWKPTVINRASDAIRDTLSSLDHWHRFYVGFDPGFTWWCTKPYEALHSALVEFGERLASLGASDSVANNGLPASTKSMGSIIGEPLGREALLAELAFEMIPYSPEELVDIANSEHAWCEQEIKKASADLGFGDDWHAALEYVKSLHGPPGTQPELVRSLAIEAVEFLDTRDLVTIPALARETWRLEMMSPDQQLINPFFLGGETIRVSFPTDSMSHEQKLMSMRGNNVHFARATVQHELIPGHHLQGFMMDRHRTHRRVTNTVFWIEGWALYWEMRLWDLGFANTPENRIGMLFWRMHRSARIIFSLGFHLESMTPDECVEFLVDHVGHERANALAEVRRSFGGEYNPLYQCAYLLGGLQIRALHRELVETGALKEREFHDEILHQNTLPIEMLRFALKEQSPPYGFVSSWRFYEDARSWTGNT